MIVVDASALFDLLVGAASPAGDQVAEQFSSRQPVCAPHLIDAEVAQAVRRYDIRGDLGETASEMLVDLVALPLIRFPHAGLLGRAFGFRHNVTIYDGLYLALAEVLECPLLTGDAALSRVPGCTADVVVVETSR